MEPDCKALIDKYVRSDSVIACLELTGYTSALLIRNLDSNQIDQIEEFVRHACTVMNPNQARSFLGSVFSCHADKFCFPIGVRMGLMLAVNELKSLNSNISQLSQRPIDKCVQTDLTIGCSLTASFLNPNLHFLSKFPPSNQSVTTSGEDNHSHLHHQQQQQSMLRLSTDLSCCSGNGSSSNMDLSLSSDRETKSPMKSPSSTLQHPHQPHPQQQQVGNVGDARLLALKLPQPHCLLSQQSPPHSQSQHDINLEHLRQHSSASAIRLASRQFLNANLVQNRHFKIDMEVTPTAEGPVRVTGIFSCHLCRQKRDRSTPVRFSIARNRYPVMSNVLSHLKIHFQPLVTAGGTGCGSVAIGNNGEGLSELEDGMGESATLHRLLMVKQESQLGPSGHGNGPSNGGYSQSDSSVGVDSLSPFNLDHLIMSGGGPGGTSVHDMKMFSVAAVAAAADKPDR